jgi:hypothetical protein
MYVSITYNHVALAMIFSKFLLWVNIIISPGSSLGVPPMDHHKFQIFIYMACDILWFYKNKAFHDGLSFDALSIFVHINKNSLLSISKLSNLSLKPQWKNGSLIHLTSSR